jgi:hypothetical protein
VTSIFILREQTREDAFRAWLLEHEAQLYQGGADYCGVTLMAASPVYRYRYVYSLLLLHVAARGRPLIEGADDIRGARFGYDVVTLLLGWWFLWRGPFVTVAALRDNHRRGGPEPITIDAA